MIFSNNRYPEIWLSFWIPKTKGRRMKIFCSSEEQEEIRKAGYTAGYQEGYETMRQIAVQALNGYYKLVVDLVKLQNLDLRPVPSIEEPNLAGYLTRVLTEVMNSYFLYQASKERNTALETSLATKEWEVKYWTNRSQEAESQLRKEKAKWDSAVEKEMRAIQEQKKLLLERNAQLEKIIGELQNRLDWQGNKSGQQTG
jgi:hypothetical protein